jgi:secernin
VTSVCDTLCVLGDGVTLFAKNSDRPRSEPQILEAFAGRPGGGRLRTQYLEIPDAGAAATSLSRPTWLWGAEHGMNEHRVVIGNEAIFTVDDASQAPPALIGMDLVRLGLERGHEAAGALDAMTDLLGSHGQGGVCDGTGFAYWSSFLIADPTSAWILETSGRTWAARPVVSGAAISNRLTLGRDWTQASSDVPPHTDVDSWRHRSLPTGFADRRLAAGRAFVDGAGARAGTGCDPRAVVGALRDHGSGPWGVPGDGPAVTPVTAAPAPDQFSADGDGWTVCLHAPPSPVTTASMVALLPEDPHRPARAWVALGSPCVSVYVPVPAPGLGAPVPAVVADAGVWHRFATIRDAVGSDAGTLAAVRAELSVVEDTLWDAADHLGTDPGAWARFGLGATEAVAAALDRLVAAGIGPSGVARSGTARSGDGPKSDR